MTASITLPVSTASAATSSTTIYPGDLRRKATRTPADVRHTHTHSHAPKFWNDGDKMSE